MAFEQKDGRGTIWLVVKERENEKGKYQFYSGDCLINNAPYWISAYPKTVQTNEGVKNVLSLSFRPKNEVNKSSDMVHAKSLPALEPNELKVEEIPF